MASPRVRAIPWALILAAILISPSVEGADDGHLSVDAVGNRWHDKPPTQSPNSDETTDSGTDDELEDGADDAKGRDGELASLNPSDIVSTQCASVRCTGHNVRTCDIDGDGRLEFISPGWQGEIVVVYSDGKMGRTLRLNNIPSGASIVAAEPFRDGKELHWVVAFSKYHLGMQEFRGVAAYDDDGKPLWVFKPELPEKRSAHVVLAAGDLNGDGKAEIVIGLTHYSRVPSGDRSFTLVDHKAWIIILDANGAPLARREVGSRIETLVIAAEKDRQKPSAILCFGVQEVQRFTFNPGSAAPTTP